jgi:hypothetical protein
MSWNELERLVEEAEADGVIRRALRHCRSRAELILASRRLGYRITRVELQRAWMLHCREEGLPGVESGSSQPRALGKVGQPDPPGASLVPLPGAVGG